MLYDHIPQKSYQVRGAMDISFQFKVSFDVEQGRPGTGEIWHSLSKPPQLMGYLCVCVLFAYFSCQLCSYAFFFVKTHRQI